MIRSKNIDYSVVIPIFNAEKSLPILYSRLIAILSQLNKNFEIIFIDDGSRDKSWEILENIYGNDNNVKIIQLMKNFGQHRALMCGLQYAEGKYVITMDDDLQHPPEEIPKLIRKIQLSRMDAVIGKPISKRHSSFKNMGSIILDKLYTLILKKPKNVRVGSFCILTDKLVSEIRKETTSNPMLNALMFKNTRRIINETVNHHKRKYGKTTYSLSKLLTICYNLIINYSALPLKLVSVIGFLASSLGFVGFIYVFTRAMFGKTSVAGWASTVLLILFFSGLILFSFGIVGEYLIRILQEVGNQEQYKIRKAFK
jgi:glycosyltransferase involved in cell wall biosynthesis